MSSIPSHPNSPVIDPQIQQLQETWTDTPKAMLYVEQLRGPSGTSYQIKPICPTSRLGTWLVTHISVFNWIYTAIVKLGLRLTRGDSVHMLSTMAGGERYMKPTFDHLQMRIIRELPASHPLLPKLLANFLVRTDVTPRLLQQVFEESKRSLSSHAQQWTEGDLETVITHAQESLDGLDVHLYEAIQFRTSCRERLTSALVHRIRADWDIYTPCTRMLVVLQDLLPEEDPMRFQVLIKCLKARDSQQPASELQARILQALENHSTQIDAEQVSTIVQACTSSFANPIPIFEALFRRIGCEEDPSTRNQLMRAFADSLRLVELRDFPALLSFHRLMKHFDQTSCVVLRNWLVLNQTRLRCAKRLLADEAFDSLDEEEKEEIIQLVYWNTPDYFSTSRSFGSKRYALAIRLQDLQAKPEKVLDSFYGYCYVLHPGVRKIKVDFLTQTLRPGPGSDAGGLRRQFVSTLFGSLARSAEDDNHLDLLYFKKSNAGVLPSPSEKTPLFRYRTSTPNSVLDGSELLSDAELEDAATLAYGGASDAPAYLRTPTGGWDYSALRLKFHRVQDALPVLSDQEEGAYEAIGKLMGLCIADDELVTGLVFEHRLFEMLAAAPLTDLDKDFHALSLDSLLPMYLAALGEDHNDGLKRLIDYYQGNREFTPEMLWDVYMDWEMWPEAFHQGFPSGSLDEPPLPTSSLFQAHRDEVRRDLTRILLALARAEVAPAFLMAKGMRIELLGATGFNRRLSPDELNTRIQGQFSKRRLREAVQENAPSDACDHLVRWIDESDTDKVKHFLKVVTGSPSLAAAGEICLVECNWEPERLLSFHTCSNEIHLAQSYSSYERFRQTLEVSLEHAMPEEGPAFQFT